MIGSIQEPVQNRNYLELNHFTDLIIKIILVFLVAYRKRS